MARKKKGDIATYLTQAYVMHQTGIVVLSRKYAEGCINSNPQLIGGIIGAILTFVNSSLNPGTYCSGTKDGQHKLTEISTSCSVWYIHSDKEYTTALLIPNGSPLNEDPDLIAKITSQLLETFILYRQFEIEAAEEIPSEMGTEDLGNTVDNIVKDVVKEYYNEAIDFADIGEVQHFHYST